MLTPFGKECRYFYGDYHRGRNHEECRLINASDSQSKWSSKLCKNCPVPEIIQANACPTMILEGEVSSVIFGFRKFMRISAYCTKTQESIKEPRIGCGSCHPIPEIFFNKE